MWGGGRRDRTAREIQGLVGELDDKYREVIELRYLAQKSYNEIAELMDIPVGTVKTYIYRAKLNLKERMVRRSGGTPGGKERHDELRSN